MHVLHISYFILIFRLFKALINLRENRVYHLLRKAGVYIEAKGRKETRKRSGKDPWIKPHIHLL